MHTITGLTELNDLKTVVNLVCLWFVADHALAFMVRGLYKKCKQPLGYFLTVGTVKPETLQTLTQSCLEKLEKIGLETKALICDQGPNNRYFLQKLENVSTERPDIVSNNKKVFAVYDPPHLLNNVRNNFKESNFKYGDAEVKREYIVDFYNMDKVMSIRMAPKLTNKHITFPPFSTICVKLAAQTLSHSVAAGINTLCALKCLPVDANAAAEFIETFDQLFNAFNSASFKSSHKHKNALSENSGHI